MSMGGGGGGGVVQTGVSQAAASNAAQAQISAARAASEAATANTHTAIQALMGQYGTALTYANPIVNTGNQAAAQLTYMLGLQAVSPGAEPTAPNMPTLEDALGKVTKSQIRAEMSGDITQDGNWFQYGGPGIGNPAWNYVGTRGHPDEFTASGQILNNPYYQDQTKQELAQNNLDQNLLPQYQEQLTNFNQNDAQWGKENDLYNRYNAMGVATPADLTNIVQNLPGYQFQFGQGMQGIQNAASASGMLNSGALLQQLNQFGQGQASSYYNNYLNQLQSLAGYGAGATGQVTAGAANLGNQIAGQYSNLGDTQANSLLAAGQAQASSYLSPLANQESRTVGGGGGGSGWGQALGAGIGLLGKFL